MPFYHWGTSGRPITWAGAGFSGKRKYKENDRILNLILELVSEWNTAYG